MIEIAIDKTPPTQQAIDAEKQVLEANRLSIKRKAITLLVAAIMISATTIAALWFVDIISVNQVLIGALAGAVVVAIAVAVAIAGADAIAGALAGIFVVALAGVIVLAGSYDVAIVVAGAYAVAIVVAIFTAAIAVASGAIKNKKGRISAQIATISPIAKIDCPELVKICKRRQVAAAYIKAVTVLNRKPTQGEFEMLKAYDQSYEAKNAAAQLMSEQDKACELICSGEF